MVNTTKKTIGLELHDNDLNSYSFIVEVIMQVLGYEITQAVTCANMIVDRGSYVVKSFHKRDLDVAEALLELFMKNDVPARIIKIKK
jgi:hypothetical protein